MTADFERPRPAQPHSIAAAINPQHVRVATWCAAGALFVGSVTPWITIRGFLNMSANGTEGDGKITLVLAVLAALLATAPAYTYRRGLRAAVTAVGLVSFVIAVNVTRQLGDDVPELVLVSAGWGLWLTIIAAIALAAVPFLTELPNRGIYAVGAAALIAVIVPVWLAGRAGSPQSTACSEMFASGRPVSDVLADSDAGPCYEGEDAQIVITANYDCPDGRSVHYNDWGVGVDGGTWQPPLDDGFTTDALDTLCSSPS